MEEKNLNKCTICGYEFLDNEIMIEHDNGYVHTYCETYSKPVEITSEFIRTLRASGQHDAADELLKAFHKSKRQEKENLIKELDSRERKILHNICVRHNMCVMCKVNPMAEGKKYCQDCLERKKKYYKHNLIKLQEKKEKKQEETTKDGTKKIFGIFG